MVTILAIKRDGQKKKISKANKKKKDKSKKAIDEKVNGIGRKKGTKGGTSAPCGVLNEKNWRHKNT